MFSFWLSALFEMDVGGRVIIVLIHIIIKVFNLYLPTEMSLLTYNGNVHRILNFEAAGRSGFAWLKNPVVSRGGVPRRPVLY